MNISFNWLKQYVNLPDSISAEEVAEKLKLSTVEVEKIKSLGALLNKVVVGKIVSLENHPQADKLKLCQVDVGKEKLQIVCGGSNLRKGMLVALAKIGAKVKWHGQGDLVELKEVKIRNIDSHGMICGAEEIGLLEMFPPVDNREIIDLTERVSNKSLGKPLAEVLDLDDTVLEIDNKSLSNRPDLWGHYGMAREVAVLFGKNLNEYKTESIKAGKGKGPEVEIKDTSLCPRYMAAIVHGVKVGESPAWLKKRLLSAGIRSINNIVDITNYIMLDLGEPMHAFDAKQLVGSGKEAIKIIVRKAEKDEILTLLDGNKIELDQADLVIADSEKPLALAGIMGGELSGVNEKTESVVFESANFNAAAIRRSSIRHGLRTDSSTRFEKSLDPTFCQTALEKAVAMLLQFCPEATVAGKLADKKDYVLKTGPISVDKKFFEKKLGLPIPEKEIVKILENLGFGVEVKKDSWIVKVPSWRAAKDIAIAEDLVEEVARVFGYEKIPATMPLMSIAPPPMDEKRRLERRLRDILIRDSGYCEVDNYAFISQQQREALADKAEYLELDNPLSKEKPFLRRSLLPNLAENIVANIEFFDQVKIFEIGKTFLPELPGVRADTGGAELLPRQDVWFAACFSAKKNQMPVVEARRVLEKINRELRIDFEIVSPKTPLPWQHPTRTVELKNKETVLGALYELHPTATEKFGLSVRLGVLELNLDLLAEALSLADKAQYEKISAFPEVIRDLAFTVDQSMTHAQIVAVLHKADSLIKKVELFDFYQGEKLPPGKKSLAYHLTIADPEKTLTSEEVEAVVKKAGDLLKKKIKAEIRI